MGPGRPGPAPTPIAIRFERKVRKGDGCWEWTGKISSQGYGIISTAPSPGIELQLLTHRVAYELAHGPVSADAVICHRCDNKKCVRPDHLFLGTHSDNHADMVSKGRNPKGEDHGGAKLTDQKVLEIRARRRSGALQPRLAEEFGVTQGAISRIVRRKNWSHLPQEQIQ